MTALARLAHIQALAAAVAEGRAPLAIDLYAGLGGWTDGLLAEGWHVIGFDIEQHVYGEHRYPAQLVIQDVLTLHGSQFKDAALIVASPPCQFFSYCAMPWSRAKALAAKVRADPVRLEKELALFRACFRIQREACEAAGRHIPLIVENVRGAQPWVGPARWSWGSFYLWGDIPALMPITGKVLAKRAMDDLKYGQRKLLHSHLPVGNGPLGRNDGTEGRKVPGLAHGAFPPGGLAQGRLEGRKVPGFRFDGSGRSFQSALVAEGRKTARDGLGGYGGDFGWDGSPLRRGSSKSSARKAASAMIAKIPLPLSQWVARCFLPRASEAA